MLFTWNFFPCASFPKLPQRSQEHSEVLPALAYRCRSRAERPEGLARGVQLPASTGWCSSCSSFPRRDRSPATAPAPRPWALHALLELLVLKGASAFVKTRQPNDKTTSRKNRNNTGAGK